MPKFYRLTQGGFYENKWVSPHFPLTPENIKLNISIGLMKEIPESDTKSTTWGTGVYKIEDNGMYSCIVSDYDSSD